MNTTKFIKFCIRWFLKTTILNLFTDLLNLHTSLTSFSIPIGNCLRAAKKVIDSYWCKICSYIWFFNVFTKIKISLKRLILATDDFEETHTYIYFLFLFIWALHTSKQYCEVHVPRSSYLICYWHHTLPHHASSIIKLY